MSDVLTGEDSWLDQEQSFEDEAFRTDVDFCFIRTPKSSGPGVLCTHGLSYKFTKTGVGKDGRIWWRCSQYENCRCDTRAITKTTTRINEQGQEEETTVLVAVTRPEVRM